MNDTTNRPANNPFTSHFSSPTVIYRFTLWKRKHDRIGAVLPLLLHQPRNIVEQFAILIVTTARPVTCLAILHESNC
jgi:hypothetical protein